MTKHFFVDPESSAHQTFLSIAQTIKSGGVFAYPADSGYAIGCLLKDSQAVKKMIDIRGDKPLTSMVAASVEALEPYVLINHSEFRYLKKNTPNCHTFVLPLSKLGQKIFKAQKRKEVGIRIPLCSVTLLLLECLDQPILSCSLKIDGQKCENVDDLPKSIEHQFDHVVNAGYKIQQSATIVRLCEGTIEQVR